VNVYLETSAALRDLLDGGGAEEVRRALRDAEIVCTSRLTLAEVARVMVRLRVLEPNVAARVTAREAAFVSESELWSLYPVDEDIWARCGRPFPVEPVRVLDGLHLATIERVTEALADLVVLTTDDRIRQNAQCLGIEVLPAGDDRTA
jgi:predicted nucleic acid-binding protein